MYIQEHVMMLCRVNKSAAVNSMEEFPAIYVTNILYFQIEGLFLSH